MSFKVPLRSSILRVIPHGFEGVKPPSRASNRQETAACSIFKIMGPQNRESILAARILMVLSASIIFTLGVVHLVYTFWGPQAHPP